MEPATAALTLTSQAEINRLQEQLKTNPHQPGTWRELVGVAELIGDRSILTSVYDAFLNRYPNTVQVQVKLLQLLSTVPDNHHMVEALFQEFLKSSPCVELWNLYLAYVSQIGQDKDSGNIWYDYIQFLSASMVESAEQRIESLRSVYYRAIQIPLTNVERLWKDLDTLETNLNPAVAKQIMAQFLPAHNRARKVYKELLTHLSSLYDLPSTQELYIPSIPKFDSSARVAVGKWKAYLKWEEGNPLQIPGCKKETLVARLMWAYRHAVINMRYFPEIWYMAFVWCKRVGRKTDADDFLKAGLEANQASYTLNFALVEELELQKNFNGAHVAYKKFLALLRANLEHGNAAQSSTAQTGASPVPSATGGGAADSVVERSSQSTTSSCITSSNGHQVAGLQDRRSEYGLAWVMYMRFARRAEGFQSARDVFAEARKDRWVPWQVFEAAAMMEYHCPHGGKDVAVRILHKGLEIFCNQIEFIKRYLGFLISINDAKNAHALFESAVLSLPPGEARPLWEQWAEYQYHYGALEASLKLESRWANAYPTDSPIKRLAFRHRHMGVDAIANRDLGFALVRSSPTVTLAVKRGRPVTPDEQDQTAASAFRIGTGGNMNGSSFKRASFPVSGRRSSRPHRERASENGGPVKFAQIASPASEDQEVLGKGAKGAMRAYSLRRDSSLPSVLTSFLASLPVPESFNGPVFNTDDVMKLFRTIVIPSSEIRDRSPPLPQRGYSSPHFNTSHGRNSGSWRRY